MEPAAHGGGLALLMKTWSRDVVMCSDGPSHLSGKLRQRLKRTGSMYTKRRSNGWKER